MKIFVFLGFVIAAAVAVPANPQRIIGGSETTINQYPSIAAMLYSSNLATFVQACGGTILTTRSILTAAHCYQGDTASNWRVRVGSTYGNSGGAVHNVQVIIDHEHYNTWTYENDISIIRLATAIIYGTGVTAGSIAGVSYVVADNQQVWAAGWGLTSVGGSSSEILRHVQIWTINLNTCRERYSILGYDVTDNMLCSGWLDVGGRDQCLGDSGGPLYHNNVVVGVCSWGIGCADARFPGVNARVSSYTNWIQANAQ